MSYVDSYYESLSPDNFTFKHKYFFSDIKCGTSAISSDPSIPTQGSVTLSNRFLYLVSINRKHALLQALKCKGTRCMHLPAKQICILYTFILFIMMLKGSDTTELCVWVGL